MKPFIKIGDLHLNRSDIIEINEDWQWQTAKKGADFGEYEIHHAVRITTCAQVLEWTSEDSGIAISATHDFEHDTPEAAAILKWLDDQTEDLLAVSQDDALKRVWQEIARD